MTADASIAERKPPRAPAGLDRAGRALWRQIAGTYDLEPHEVPHLTDACRLADRVAELEALVTELGPTVEGSQGQTRLNPAIAEARLTRLAIGRCLGQIAFPDADDQPTTAASRRARNAASARWRAHGA